MADKSIIDNSKLTAIADAIRTKTGGTDTLTADQMATEIATLVLPQGTATAANVLKNKTFINSTGELVTGSMTNRGGAKFTISTKTGTVKITSGYHNGGGTASIPEGSILIPPSGTTLENTSWDAIQFLAQTNKLTNYFSVGDTKAITVGGTSCAATLIGINHDKSNSATFIVTLPTAYKMFTGSNTSGGWGSSTLRSTLNDTVLGTLNTDLQNVLTSVTKTYNTTASSGSSFMTTSTCTDKLFIPSWYEIYGTSAYYDNNGNLANWTLVDGARYDYFKSNVGYISSRFLVRSIPQWQRVGFVEANEDKPWIFWFNTSATVRMCFVVG